MPEFDLTLLPPSEQCEAGALMHDFTHHVINAPLGVPISLLTVMLKNIQVETPLQALEFQTIMLVNALEQLRLLLGHDANADPMLMEAISWIEQHFPPTGEEEGETDV